jgi:phage repressor protein C with HTH and peptisase S24 domain
VKSRPVTVGPGAGQAAFVERLVIVAQLWPSSDSLAKAAGVSPSALRKWLKGQAEPSRERLVALADAAGVGVSWLAKGEGPAPDLSATGVGSRAARNAPAGQRLEPGNFLVLPKQVHAVAAGAGHPVPRSSATEFIGFRHEWVKDTFELGPADLILDTAVGDSMEPNIRDGDLLLVDVTDRSFRSFGVYVLEVRGERLVKRVQRLFNGSLILISDNRVYQPEEIAPEDAGEINAIGRVVWRGGQL